MHQGGYELLLDAHANRYVGWRVFVPAPCEARDYERDLGKPPEPQVVEIPAPAPASAVIVRPALPEYEGVVSVAEWDAVPVHVIDLPGDPGLIQEELITALMHSSAWPRSAYILTYDEAGGYFDHVPPPQLDAFGLGIRLPTWVISPWAKRSHLEGTLYEHTSILKFIETVFGLPTLASVNHLFDQATPVGSNYEAAAPGALGGPPAPPRDGRTDIGNLMECFAF